MGQETPSSMGGELGYSEELMPIYPIYGKASFKPSGDFEADQQAITYLKRLIHWAFCNEISSTHSRREKTLARRKKAPDRQTRFHCGDIRTTA